MVQKSPPPRVVEFDPTHVRDISEAVYRDRLTADDLAKMLADIGAAKLRERAGSYDALTRSYLRAIKADEVPR